MRKPIYRNLWLVAGAAGAFSTLTTQGYSQFTNVSSGTIPQIGLATEAAKFGDWDGDGDLDMVWANGGDLGNQQSKIIRNGTAGGAGTGVFFDVTASMFLKNPTTVLMSQSSRDVQPVDVDNDGDLDFYMSNHSMQANQSNTWFINQGLAQGGVQGKFILDMSRWVGVGVSGSSGSSVPAAQKITSGDFAGGFVDWSCQCDFADADLDGDWDLLHTSYGVNFDATVMTRLFLNQTGTSGSLTSLGFFQEYNPSGAISNNPTLPSGSQAGFVEGSQVNDTTKIDGTEHDITNVSLDADFSDIDGDFDNDIFANSRDTISRFWSNRFFENGGSTGAGSSRAYRDVTNQWGVNGLDTEFGNNYDADINDMDNDGDTDGYFLGYSGATSDEWRLNDGTGVMGAGLLVPSSSNDDNEIDWVDWDNDNDPDPFVSAFSGSDRLYKNMFIESGSVNLTLSSTGTTNGTRTLGADVGDYDNDGDADIICAEDAASNEVLLRSNGTPDAWAPRVVNILQLANGTPSSQPRRVVARAYDNSNQEHFIHGSGTLEFTVDGVTHVIPAKYAGGNLWLAWLPGYWCGNITYKMKVKDRKGNEGTSATKSVTITPAGFSTFGSSIPGCHGAMTVGVNSCPTVNNSEFAMTCTGGPLDMVTQLCLATNSQGTGLDEFGVGLPIWADFFFATDAYGLDALNDGTGKLTASAVIPNNPLLAGAMYYFQIIVGDVGCGQVLSTSGGGMLTIQP
ncbi:MAG: VCBS repeat-containing protein, partial [Planctomycetes bacterium]|nr:VCBS repeat-containing protein [Planctomycetota bacterium]